MDNLFDKKDDWSLEKLERQVIKYRENFIKDGMTRKESLYARTSRSCR